MVYHNAVFFFFLFKLRLFIPGCNFSSAFKNIKRTIKQMPRRIIMGSSNINTHVNEQHRR